MGVLSRFERRLGGAVEGGFARVFRSRVEPVELAVALKREADANRTVGPTRTLIPNQYEIDLGPSDYDRLAPYRLTLGDELAEMVREHASEQRYETVGPVEVTLLRTEDLHTGAYRVGSRVEADTHPAPDPSPPAAEAPPGPPDLAYAPPPVVEAPYAPRPDLAMTTAIPAATRTYGQLELPGGEWVTIASQPLVLGRGHEADVRLADASVSRRHGRLHVEADRLVLEDLGSTNGTSVNGERVARAELRDGDILTLGAATITYRA